MMYLILSALTMLLTMQQGATPVNPANTYRCNYAKVKKLKPGQYLAVRSGAGAHYQSVDRLRADTEVYTCDERGDWLKIFYGSGPCSQTLRDGIDSKETASCKSGWVNREWIDIISG
jgi:uncharacterized protein YgiM (DUF1202 family)